MKRTSLLLSTVIIAHAAAMAQSPSSEWHQEPFRVKSGERLVDTYDNDPGAHSAPFMGDVDGDGRRDLVVGSIHGRFRLYRNVGTDGTPRFDERSSWVMAGLNADEPARVPNFCCVASGPQLVDIDGDGIPDLSSGSYAPAQVYWFKGRGDGTFHARQILTDMQGRPVVPVPEQNPYGRSGDYGNLMLNVAWTDWDNNGSMDMIVGNYKGQLFVWLNATGIHDSRSLTSMPSATQPVFFQRLAANWRDKASEILIDGSAAIPDIHAAPAVADWDGDGLWDILAGTNSGRVYWLRNSGKPGQPKFEERQEILGAGQSGFWVGAGQQPGRGIRSQIHAVDYNRDGKMDLLVGEWAVVQMERPDLTRAERRRMHAIRKELQALDEKAGFKPEHFVRYQVKGYTDDKPMLQRAQALETQLTEFLMRYRQEDVPDYLRFTSFQKEAGHVWVYLRK